MIQIPREPDTTRGPLVSYIIPTYNRPQYLATAIRSALDQEYHNLQVIVVRDGGQEVKDVLDQFADDRLEFIDRAENWGKCRSLNQAIEHVRGKYICYLDDDDLHYPNHVRRLVQTLEADTDCQAAYSDLNCTLVHLDGHGNRKILGKSVVVSRDYDPFFLLQYNTAPHGSTIHRTDLLAKTGLYNPEITVLIDWDIARRISFFSDFAHLPEVTGDFHTQINQRHSDRISDMQRKDKGAFSDRCRKIIWSRPEKPWPKRSDTSIVYLLEKVEPKALSVISAILTHTFIPYQLYLPLTAEQIAKLNLGFDQIHMVQVPEGCSSAQRLDAALAACDGDFVAVVPDKYPITEGKWVEQQVWALEHNDKPRRGYWLAQKGNRKAAVVRREELAQARQRYPKGSIWRSLEMAGIRVGKITFAEAPGHLDHQLYEAEMALRDEDFIRAAERFADIQAEPGDRAVCLARAAWCFYRLGGTDADTRGLAMARKARQLNPTVDMDLLSATLLYRLGEYEKAAAGYEQVLQQLERYEV